MKYFKARSYFKNKFHATWPQENNLGESPCICNRRLQIHTIYPINIGQMSKWEQHSETGKKAKREGTYLKTSSHQSLSLATDLIFHNHHRHLLQPATSTTPNFYHFYVSFSFVLSSWPPKLPVSLCHKYFSIVPLHLFKSGFLNLHPSITHLCCIFFRTMYVLWTSKFIKQLNKQWNYQMQFGRGSDLKAPKFIHSVSITDQK